MLAVKWMYDRDGVQVEHVYEAETVTAAFAGVPANTPKLVGGEGPVTVWGREVDSSLVVINGYNIDGRSFNCGKIYVMSGGKTVASYDLGPVKSHFDEPAVSKPLPVATPQAA